jgi:uncharacterized protein (TIGR02145 family)
VAISSNLPGARVGYSTDRIHWLPYPNGGLTVSQNEILYAEDTLGSIVSAIDSSVYLYIPSIAQSGSSPIQQTVTITPAGASGIQDSLNTLGGWKTYTGAFTIAGNTKVYARSSLEGISTSIQEADFAVAPTMVASPNDTGVSSLNVTITSPSADSIQASADQQKTWTTLRGSTYSAGAGTLYARSLVGGAVSPVDSIAVHLIQGTPTFSSPAGTYPIPLFDTIASKPNGATIYYTTDGTAPTSKSTLYTGPIAVGISDTIRAIAIQNGFGNSAVNTAAYVIPDTTGGYNPNVSYGLVKDANGNLYRTVKIGSQTWMAQDLINPLDGLYSNGSSPFTWSQAMGLPDTCDESQCTVDSTVNIQGACPANYHIPTNLEWNTLIQFAANIGNPALAHLSEYIWVDFGRETNLTMTGDNILGFSLPVNSPSAGPGYAYAYSAYWTGNQYPPQKAGEFWAGIGSTTGLGINSNSKSNVLGVRCLKN